MILYAIVEEVLDAENIDKMLSCSVKKIKENEVNISMINESEVANTNCPSFLHGIDVL